MRDKATDLLDNLTDAIPRLLIAVAIVVIGYALSRALRWLLRRLFETRRTRASRRS